MRTPVHALRMYLVGRAAGAWWARTSRAPATPPLTAALAALRLMVCLMAMPPGAAHGQDLQPLGPLDATGHASYYISEGLPGSGYQAGDADLARWALAAWQRATGGRLTFEPAREEEALVRVYWVPAGAGQYGEMKALQLGHRRGAAVFIRPDIGGLGPAVSASARADTLFRDAVVYLTCLHEFGHAVGLSHTAQFRDIMYSFGFGGDIRGFFQRFRDELRTREDLARVPGLSDSDVARVRDLYPTR